MPFRNVCVLATQSCQTLCDPMDCSPPVHGILQARILEWIAISFSRGSSRPRDWTPGSYNAGSLFTDWAIREYKKGDIISWFAADSMGLNWIFWANLLIGLPRLPCGEGNGTPLQYSCLESPMDGGAWKAAVHGVAEVRTRLKWLSSSSSSSSRLPWGEGNGSPLQYSCLENPVDGGAW